MSECTTSGEITPLLFRLVLVLQLKLFLIGVIHGSSEAGRRKHTYKHTYKHTHAHTHAHIQINKTQTIKQRNT